jgi:DUF1009 family protein
MDDLTLPPGPLGRVIRRSAADRVDIDRALEVARAIGRLDVGQAAVVCPRPGAGRRGAGGHRRHAGAVSPTCRPPARRSRRRRGVLAKAPKPIQETRVDLPTIGLATVQRASPAPGWPGSRGRPGRLLVLDREAVIALADDLGPLHPRRRAGGGLRWPR